MRSLILILSLILIITAISSAQPDTLWTRTYGGPDHEECSSVYQTFDGGYILAGFRGIYGNGISDFYIVKTDSVGDTLWTRIYGTGVDDYCSTILQTQEGNFVFSGSAVDYSNAIGEIYIAKTDENGDTLWITTINLNSYQDCNTMIETDDGSLVVGGRTGDIWGWSDMFLAKVNSEGDTIWTQSYDYGGDETCECIQQTDDSDYLLVGNDSWGDGDDLYLVQTDPSGFPLWTRNYAYPNNVVCRSLIRTSDGGYIIAGSLAEGYERYMFLFKCNADGDSIWTHTYDPESGLYDYCESAIQTPDGGFMLCGFTTNGMSRPSYRSVLVKTDSMGIEEWIDINGYELSQIYHSILQASDGGIVVGGYIDQELGWPPDGDMYLVKLALEGMSSNKQPTDLPKSFILNPPNPNPFNQSTVISYRLKTNNNISLLVYDIMGQEVASLVDGYRSAGTYSTTFNSKNLVSGVYFVRLEAGNFNQVKKVVLMK
jgi:hypothetical protein